MIQRISNIIRIEIEGASLEGASDLEFYIRQWGGLFIELTPTIVDASHIEVEIPFEEAMKLQPTRASLQLAFTNANGYRTATDVLSIPVGELLKEEGYD